VLELVAAKTGYPREMLALDLDLEADLGIDTVKQAEVFAELRTTFELPRREELKLRDYPTLNRIIELVRELKPELGPPPPQPAPHLAAVAAPVPPAAVAVATPAPAATDPVAEKVLELVAAKTGYPREMLALDLDLEADLGIDTVKQAEVFAELRTTFGLPRRESLKLRDYPTLTHIIGLVRELKSEASAPPVAQSPAVSAAAKSVRVVRRTPIPVLRPELSLCKETKVRLEAGARVAVIPDAAGIAPELERRLRERGVEVLLLGEGPVEPQLQAFASGGPIAGLFHLSALEVEPDLLTADFGEVCAVLDARVRRLYAASRALLPRLSEPGCFLIAGTRLNGLHGFGTTPSTAPAGGGVSGFVKAFARENPQALVKVVDFSEAEAPASVAEALVAEALRDPGAVEIGHAYGARHTLALAIGEAPAPVPGLELGPESVFLITGAGGGITAAIVRDLATAARGGKFWLSDILPPLDASNPDLEKLRRDREGLKRELFERLKSSGDRATPAAIDKILAGVERDLARLDTLRALEALGATVSYRAADVRDPHAVSALVEEIKAAHGHIDVILHAAGIEKSRMLADKGKEEFDTVFDIKALGLLNLLRATRELPLGAVVSFTSVAGRFGNGGQTDYSAGNDFLSKLGLSLPRVRPEVRALSLDWTAWGGAGMATRGSIPEMMRRAGIDMMPLEEGVPVVRREILAGTRGELVIGGSLGILLEPRDAQGGLDPTRVEKWREEQHLPMIGRVLRHDPYEGLVIETSLDPVAEPFLRDHAIDGVSLLPGVMGLEGFAEAARLLVPSHRVSGFEQVRFEAPVKFHRQQPRPFVLRALLRREGPTSLAADVTLSSTRPSPAGEVEVRHFSGTVRLTEEPAAPLLLAQAAQAGGDPARPVKTEDIYRIYFHGPAYQVLGEVEVTGESARSHFRRDLPPALRDRDVTLVSPRLIELCLQTAGVYEIGKTGRMALPAAIDHLVSYGAPDEDQSLFAEVRQTGENGSLTFAARVLDEQGRIYLELDGYRTSALPTTLPLELIAPLRLAVTGNDA
jgi:NAD(P)-dependent dehydrogenase (short-subunit alcohol dehydrogenase family)